MDWDSPSFNCDWSVKALLLRMLLLHLAVMLACD
jgi:hypothetical protein